MSKPIIVKIRQAELDGVMFIQLNDLLLFLHEAGYPHIAERLNPLSTPGDTAQKAGDK